MDGANGEAQEQADAAPPSKLNARQGYPLLEIHNTHRG